MSSIETIDSIFSPASVDYQYTTDLASLPKSEILARFREANIAEATELWHDTPVEEVDATATAYLYGDELAKRHQQEAAAQKKHRVAFSIKGLFSRNRNETTDSNDQDPTVPIATNPLQTS